MARSSRGRWIVVVLLLAPAVLLPLLVPVYDREDPALLGFPFFFWFQFAMIVMAAVLTVAAYYVAKSAERTDREARRARRRTDGADPAGRAGRAEGGRS